MPPPTTIIMKMPLAFSVYLPSPSVARLKVQLHITEVQRPQSTMRMALSGSFTTAKLEPVNTGMLPVTVFGMRMATMMSSMATPLTTIIMVRLDTLAAIRLERKRPQSIRNQ